MARRTLRLSSTRLVVLYVALVAASASLLLGGVYFFTLRAIEREVEAVIDADLEWLLDKNDRAGPAEMIAALRQHSERWGRTGAVYLIADDAYRPIAGNLSTWPEAARAAPPWAEFDIEARDRGQSVDHPVRARVVRLPSGHRLLVGTDVFEAHKFLQGFRIATFSGIGLTTLLLALLGWWYSNRTATRVRELAATCDRIMSADITGRLPVDGSHDEFDVLGAAANRMLDRIELQTTTLRTTFDSAAHDLRSPLYRLRVRLEQALLDQALPIAARDTMQAAIVDLDRVQRTLATLLQIAQAEAGGARPGTDCVDLGALASELVELYAPQAREQRIELTCSNPSSIRVDGNRQLLAQLITNLLENALKYVPEGGRVEVRVAQSPQGIELVIADNGPGIAAADRERVLRPFERLQGDRDSGGAGLGLSLVAAVARLHGARILLEDNLPGLRVRCIFGVV